MERSSTRTYEYRGRIPGQSFHWSQPPPSCTCNCAYYSVHSLLKAGQCVGYFPVSRPSSHGSWALGMYGVRVLLSMENGPKGSVGCYSTWGVGRQYSRAQDFPLALCRATRKAAPGACFFLVAPRVPSTSGPSLPTSTPCRRAPLWRRARARGERAREGPVQALWNGRSGRWWMRMDGWHRGSARQVAVHGAAGSRFAGLADRLAGGLPSNTHAAHPSPTPHARFEARVQQRTSTEKLEVTWDASTPASWPATRREEVKQK